MEPTTKSKEGIGDMPRATRSVDMSLVQECISALSACAQASTVCADMDGMSGSGVCAAQCANCADMCNAMMRMMLRMNGWDMAVMAHALETGAMIMRACAEACKANCDNDDHCRLCMAACQHGSAMADTMAASLRNRA